MYDILYVQVCFVLSRASRLIIHYRTLVVNIYLSRGARFSIHMARISVCLRNPEGKAKGTVVDERRFRALSEDRRAGWIVPKENFDYK